MTTKQCDVNRQLPIGGYVGRHYLWCYNSIVAQWARVAVQSITHAQEFR
jgi:hypothetical protein